MQLKALTFTQDPESDKGVVPDRITMEMTLAEAAALAKLVGRLNGIAARKLGLQDTYSIYDAFCSVFNAYYDGGVGDVIPAKIDLFTLNEAPV